MPMQKIFNTLAKPFRFFVEAPLKIALPILAALSLILNVVLEICSRHSVMGTLMHAVKAPHVFIANVLIILLTLSLCLLFKRRLAVLALVSSLWVALCVTNAILLVLRSQPLTAVDFLVITDALGVVDTYLSLPVIILIVAAIVLLIAGIIVLFIKCPKSKVGYVQSIISIAALCAVCLGMSFWTSKLPVSAEDLITAYREKGCAYCFSRSLFVHGVERPDDDAVNKKDELMGQISQPTFSGTEETPNIVVVQLESFFDLSHLSNGVTLSRNPIPNFTALRENGVSGFLQVAHVGGGTANIEFEFLTGMNLDHFGIGEFPYTTALKDRACETIAANLKELDYATHAIHNHTATFYNRNTVYPNLGFDTFTPLELMTEFERNYLTFATDDALIPQIKNALNSTAGQDFIFAVSVEGHGGYPSWSTPRTEDDIEVYGLENDLKLYYQYYFYANLIRQMDETIGEIVELLEDRGEPYVLVMYGDHLPALSLTDDQISYGDIYKTEYVIKTNIELVGSESVSDINELDRDLETYQLTAYLQQLCGMAIGDITRLHQHEFETGENYDDVLRTLVYEQLYEDEAKYQPTDMKLGIILPRIDEYNMSGETLYVHGAGFNEYSTVVVDGIKRDTVFVDSFTLAVENLLFGIENVEVVQISPDGTELATATKAE